MPFLDRLHQWLARYSECELCLRPAHCSGFLCQSCFADLPYLIDACVQCAEPLPHRGRCPACQRQPPPFDYTCCNFLYREPLARWLQCLKDQRQLRQVAKLQWLMLNTRPALLTTSAMQTLDAITYIPSARTKLLRRGFNPSEFLARAVAKQWHLPLLHQALIKQGGQDQRSLGRVARFRNMKASFRSGRDAVNGLHILIVEDVVTTGATIFAAAAVLKQAGAASVGVWALAKTAASA